MNGVHDLGGMHGFGAVSAEPHEPVFHHQWERRTFALALAVMGAQIANVDEFRQAIERMPPAHYLDSSYYEHWLYALEQLTKAKGVLDENRAAPSAEPATADDSELWADADAPEPRVSGAVALRHNPKFKPRFRRGEHVLARNSNPTGHTRSPRYVRGRRGVIRCDWGTFVFPDTHAQGLKAKPQHCYSVEFTARELWGKEFPARERILVDLWEAYLEPVEAAARATRPKRQGKQHEQARTARPRNARSSRARSRRA